MGKTEDGCTWMLLIYNLKLLNPSCRKYMFQFDKNKGIFIENMATLFVLLKIWALKQFMISTKHTFFTQENDWRLLMLGSNFSHRTMLLEEELQRLPYFSPKQRLPVTWPEKHHKLSLTAKGVHKH